MAIIAEGDGQTVEQLPGNVTRVTAGTAGDTTPQASDILRSGVSDGSAYRMDAHGNVENFGGVTKATTADLVNRTSDTIMETARRPSGAPLTRAVQATDRVTVNGMEMEVRTAHALGYLTLRAGEYHETGTHRVDRSTLGKA
jgi:hypothetical protein